MIKVITALNGDNGDVHVSINTPQIKRFFPNLKGMIQNHKDCPGARVERIDQDTAMVIFSPGINLNDSPVNKEGAIGITRESAESIQKVLSVVGQFVNGVIKHCLKETEFIPLYDFSGTTRNYSFSEMQNDVVEAMKNKRNLCVIDKFQDYLDNNESPKYCFNQYLISYETMQDEYVDFVLQVRAGKLEELRKQYKDKLKKVNWF